MHARLGGTRTAKEKARVAGLLDPKRVASLIAREVSLDENQRSFFGGRLNKPLTFGVRYEISQP